MSLRFRQLQALHATIEAGTVSAAATRLGISQPGVSNLLSQLERETRVKLFERARGRLVPTPEADILYREIDVVVRGLDNVTQTAQDLQNKKAGQLQVASQHSMSFGFMPRLIARFAKAYPDLPISFQSQYSSVIQDWVLSGLFEIGVCEMPPLHDALAYHPIRVETLLAMPADSPLAALDVLTPALLADQDFIVMGPNHVTHRRLRAAFDDAGVPLRARVHTHLFKNVLSFVKEGMGVAILDRFVLSYDFEGGFVTRPFHPAIAMEMAVVTSKTRPLSIVAQEFLALLVEALEPHTIAR